MSRTSPNLSATRGNRLGIGIFRLLLKLGGTGIALKLACIVTWFYAQFDRAAFAAAENYLKLRFPGDAAAPHALKRHFHRLLRELAKMLIYSYRMGGGDVLPIEEEGSEYLPESGGAVVVLAHYGCWQASMELMNLKNGRRINIMARPDHNSNMDKYLALQKRRDFNIISTESFSGGLIEASAALSRGEAVIVMGDRPVENTATIEVDYLGGRLELPLSPWMLAARNGVPAIPVFTELRESPPRIVIRYMPPIRLPDSDTGRISPAALLPAASCYAEYLEAAAMRSPYSVFRFGSEKRLETEKSSSTLKERPSTRSKNE